MFSSGLSRLRGRGGPFRPLFQLLSAILGVLSIVGQEGDNGSDGISLSRTSLWDSLPVEEAERSRPGRLRLGVAVVGHRLFFLQLCRSS